jgi:hypothetical protein
VGIFSAFGGGLFSIDGVDRSCAPEGRLTREEAEAPGLTQTWEIQHK